MNFPRQVNDLDLSIPLHCFQGQKLISAQRHPPMAPEGKAYWNKGTLL